MHTYKPLIPHAQHKHDPINARKHRYTNMYIDTKAHMYIFSHEHRHTSQIYIHTCTHIQMHTGHTCMFTHMQMCTQLFHVNICVPAHMRINIPVSTCLLTHRHVPSTQTATYQISAAGSYGPLLWSRHAIVCFSFVCPTQ